MIDLNNSAHSNDTLTLVHNGNLSLVKKTFRSDLNRAKKNVEKQRLFKPLYTGLAKIKAAEVLDFQVNEKSAELLMPYIEGITGSFFPVYATRNLAHTLSSSLSTLLYAELNESREIKIGLFHFINKLNQVLADTSNPELNTLVGLCLKIVRGLESEIIFPMGPCHGDLTLSNIILDASNGITLIDFLDTFLETPLQDVVKLKQDYIYGWSFRKDSMVIGVKAEILCRHHYPQAILQIERMYPTQVHLLTLMSLVRIAPYVKDLVTQQWLILCLKSFIGLPIN